MIAGRIPGRTDNEIKNYWNTHLRRKLQSMGIDPTSYTVGLTFISSNSDPNSDTSTDIDEDQPDFQVNGSFVPSSSSPAAPQNQNTIANSLHLLPAQLVSSPVSSPDLSTSTSYDSASATTSEPDSSPSIFSLGETPAKQQQLEPWMHLCSESTKSTLPSQPAAACFNSSSVPSSVVAGSCGWESYDRSRMEHLQLLNPLAFSGVLPPLESSSHVHSVDVQVAPWTSASGSLFASLLD